MCAYLVLDANSQMEKEDVADALAMEEAEMPLAKDVYAFPVAPHPINIPQQLPGHNTVLCLLSPLASRSRIVLTGHKQEVLDQDFAGTAGTRPQGPNSLGFVVVFRQTRNESRVSEFGEQHGHRNSSNVTCTWYIRSVEADLSKRNSI